MCTQNEKQKTTKTNLLPRSPPSGPLAGVRSRRFSHGCPSRGSPRIYHHAIPHTGLPFRVSPVGVPCRGSPAKGPLAAVPRREYPGRAPLTWVTRGGPSREIPSRGCTVGCPMAVVHDEGALALVSWLGTSAKGSLSDFRSRGPRQGVSLAAVTSCPFSGSLLGIPWLGSTGGVYLHVSLAWFPWLGSPFGVLMARVS
jgi:hypothetical protein